MSKTGFAAAVLAIVGVATWAYNVNYATKTALGRIGDLRGEIAVERERIQVLRVEWAWLNNPERLARLTVEHGGRLGLMPMGPASFDVAGALPKPSDEVPEPDAMLLAGLADLGAAWAVEPPAGSVLPPVRPASWAAE